MRIADVWVAVRTDLSDFRRGMAELNRSTAASATSIGRTLSTVGAGMTKVGSAMTTNLTLPILAIGAATGKMALDFDKALTKIVSLTDITQDEIGGIREEILKLAPAIGKSPQELAEAFYFLASAGFDAKESMDVLTIAAQASAAGLGDTQEVAKILGAAVNAYGEENITAARAADILVAAIGQGTAEAPEFAQSLGLIIGSAAQVGAEFEDVAAALASMTLTGLSAEESAVSLNQVLVTLMKPTTEGAEALERYGLSAAGLRQQIKDEGLLSVLTTLAQKFDGDAEATAAVFGNLRALRGILALTGPAAEKVGIVFDKVADSTGSLKEAVETYLASPAAKLNKSFADIQVSAIRIGEDVLPVVADILREVAANARGLADAWKSLDPGTRDFIVKGLALAATLGPLVLIIGKITSGVGALFTGIGFLLGAKGIPTLLTKLGQMKTMLPTLGMAAAMSIPDSVSSDTTKKLLDLADAWGTSKNAILKAGAAVDDAIKTSTDTGINAIDDWSQVVAAAVDSGATSMDEAFSRAVAALNSNNGDVQAAILYLNNWVANHPIDGPVLGPPDVTATTKGFSDALGGLKPAMRLAVTELMATVQEVPGGVAVTLDNGTEVVAASAEKLAQKLPRAILQARRDAVIAARPAPAEIAAAILAGKDELDPVKAMLKAALQKPVSDARAAAQNEALLFDGRIGKALAMSGFSETQAAGIEAAGLLVESILAARPDIFDAGTKLPPALVKGFEKTRGQVIQAMRDLNHDQSLTAAEIADLLEKAGEDGLAALVRGINSGKPDAVDAQRNVNDGVKGKADELAPALGTRGRYAGKSFGDGIDSPPNVRRARDAGGNLGGAARTGMQFNSYAIGSGVGLAYMLGIGAAISTYYWVVSGKVAGISGLLGMSGSPMFTHARLLGEGVGSFYIQAMASAINSKASVLRGAMAGISQALTVQPAYAGMSSFAPRRSAWESSERSSSGVGGDTVNVYLPGRTRAVTGSEIGRDLRILGEHGKLTPKTKPIND